MKKISAYINVFIQDDQGRPVSSSDEKPHIDGLAGCSGCFCKQKSTELNDCMVEKTLNNKIQGKVRSFF